MQLRALWREDDAVSSVLGVVLMVAVTIVLAAVVGTFVLGIGSDLTDGSPSTQWEFSDNVNGAPDINSSILILHGGGDDVDRSTIEITVGGDTVYRNGNTVKTNYNVSTPWDDPITASDRLELVDGGDDLQSGEMVRIFWVSEDNSAILAEHQLG